jgi:hypothetical protein
MVTKKSDKPAMRGAAVKRGSKHARNVWRELSAIGKPVPPAERAALPSDGAKNLDHYLDDSLKEA